MNEQKFRQADKVFSTLDLKNVKNVILHATADAGHLSLDKAGKNKVDKDELLHLLTTGVLIKLDDVFYIPSQFSVTGTYVTVICAADGTTAKTFYSSEQA